MQQNTARAWGPYSKKYASLSHIAQSSMQEGARFDLTVQPALANSGAQVPNVTYPCGWHPWRAAPNGDFFSAKFELDPRNHVTATAAYFQVAQDCWGLRVHFKNPSPLGQNALVNYFAAITYPQDTVMRPVLPPEARCVQAQDYETLCFAVPRPWDHLTPDARRRGEITANEFCGGVGIGEGCKHKQRPELSTDAPGRDKGDRLTYRFGKGQALAQASLCVRYRTTGEDAVCFESEFGVLRFEPSKEPCVATFPLGELSAEELKVTLTACGSKNGVELDFLAVVPTEAVDVVDAKKTEVTFRPEVSSLGLNKFLLRYADISRPYGLQLLSNQVRCREIDTGCLEDALPSRLSNGDPTFDDVLDPFTASFARKHSDAGFFENMVVPDLFLAPKSGGTVYAVVWCGDTPPKEYTQEELEESYRGCKAASEEPVNPAGKRYRKSVRLLRTALLTNAVYPQMILGKPVVHYTPGKRWDSFYTWDSGFIGLGLSRVTPATAEFVLASYLSDAENDSFAFLHHGSIVPVQFYLFWQLLQQSEHQKEFAQKYYAGLKRYYRFLMGDEGSTMARFPGGLLTSYDYFYSAHGMDDYPAQLLMHRQKKSAFTAPAMLTAHALRGNKILQATAELLGRTDDVAAYRQEAQGLEQALQRAWDPQCGYFSYTTYDSAGKLTGFLRTEQGENANKGIDGVMPLVGGSCTQEQETRLIAHLFDRQELFTDCGITAVDRSAGYARDNGYWNGTVWFSHQWFIWKAMLDQGMPERAWQIAKTALDVWKQETEATDNTFEEMHVKTKRGGWFHQFGGLSAPVLLWTQAYYRPGSAEAGLNVWLKTVEFNTANTRCHVVADTQQAAHHSTLLVVMAAGPAYHVLCEGKELAFCSHTEGSMEIMIPAGKKQVELCIAPQNRQD